jgi:hypothetical protein
MIDLSLVPQDIKQQVIDKYEAPNDKNRSQLMNYFIKNKLRNLMEHIPEF